MQTVGQFNRAAPALGSMETPGSITIESVTPNLDSDFAVESDKAKTLFPRNDLIQKGSSTFRPMELKGNGASKSHTSSAI